MPPPKNRSRLLEAEVAFGETPESACPILVPPEIRSRLVLIDVPYYGFDGRTHDGQLIVDRDLALEVQYLFLMLQGMYFPIASMVPISAYGWSDIRSMEANNTSAWNYRLIAGSNPPRFSKHAYGRAIDINPLLNPCRSQGVWSPEGARYDPSVLGTITADSPVVELFRSRGWVCGVTWQEPFDPQHFEKPFEAF